MEDLSQSICVVNSRPAESSVEAFQYLVRQNDPNRLRDWLAKRSPEEKAFFGPTEMSRLIFWAPALWSRRRRRAARAAINSSPAAWTISTDFQSWRMCQSKRGTIPG